MVEKEVAHQDCPHSKKLFCKQFERFGRFCSFSYRSSERKRLRHTTPEKGCFSPKRAKLFSYLHAHKIYLRLAQVTVGLRCTLCRDEKKTLNKDRNNLLTKIGITLARTKFKVLLHLQPTNVHFLCDPNAISLAVKILSYVTIQIAQY